MATKAEDGSMPINPLEQVERHDQEKQEESTHRDDAPIIRRTTGLTSLDPKYRHYYIVNPKTSRTSKLDTDFRPKGTELDDTFFQEFASHFLRPGSLPILQQHHEWTDDEDEEDGPVPLYAGLSQSDGPLPEKAFEGPSGQTLAFRKLVAMNKAFALAEMRNEMDLIRKRGTTDAAQMKKIRQILVDFAILKETSIKDALKAEEDRLVELRCEEHVRLNPPTRQNTNMSLEEQVADEALRTEKQDKKTFGEKLKALAEPGGYAKWAGIKTHSLNSYFMNVERDRVLRRADFPKRFIVCIGGGISLIVPMIIMVLDPSLTKSLVTTSVATFLIAALIAWNSAGKPHELLSATAAYAAVLVIFVGFNTN